MVALAFFWFAENGAMESTQSAKLSEIPLGIVLVLFSLTALHQAYGISSFRSISSPGAMPMFAASIMLLASLTILVKSVVSESTGQTEAVRHTPFFSSALPLRLVLLIGLIALYLFFLPRLGFMVSSAFFLWVSFTYLWRCGLVRATSITGLSLIIIYLVFRTLFKVVLPQGSWLPGWF